MTTPRTRAQGPRARLRRRSITAIAIAALAFALSLGVGADLGAAEASASVSEFGAKGTGAGEFTEPRGVAVFQETGDVYLVDRNNARVDSFGPEGAFRFAIGWGVLDGKSELEVCSATCRAGIAGAGAGQLNGALGLAVDNNPASESFGDFYVFDDGNHRVQKFDSEGKFLLTFGKGVNLSTKGDVCTSAESENCGQGAFGFGPGELSQTEGAVTVDAAGAAGTVYVGDFGRVEKFTPTGEFVSQWPVGEGGGFISSVAVNKSAEVFVVGEGIAGVHRYDPFGSELGVPFDTEGTPAKLALGPSGEVYVDEHLDSDTQHPHLVEYDSTGTVLKSFDIGTIGGSLGVAFGNAIERVYVLNPAAVRLVAVPPAGPLVVPGSEVPTDAKPSHAGVKAVVDPEGSPTEVHFEYGESTAYGSATPLVPLPEEGGLFSPQAATADLTGLKPNTVYHFRAVAENELGETTFGPDATLTTPPPVLISGESTTEVTPESARLSVEINPQGAATAYHFEYGTSTAYGQSAPEPDADAGAEEVNTPYSLIIEHLSPGTVYHYRVVAHNVFGTVEGPDRTFTTGSTGSAALADGRAWEMVSPPTKNGSSLEAISEEGGLIESSERGDALAYIGRAPLGTEAEPEGNQSIADTQFVARRHAPGAWETHDITTPHERPAGFHPGRRAEYLIFSSDLSKGLVEPFGATPLAPDATERTPYVRDLTAGYTPLVTPNNVPPGTKFGGEETTFSGGKETGGGDYVGGLELVGAAADLSSAAITSPLALTEDFTTAEGGEHPSLYRWRSDTRTLQLVSWLPATTGTPQETPAAVAGDRARLGARSEVIRHAVSADGDRLIYEVEDESGEHHLFLRDMTLGKSVQLDLREDGTSGGGAPRFQDASVDGRVVFFTDEERLTANSTASRNELVSDLYRCEVQEVAGALKCNLTDLTVPVGSKEVSDVLGNIVGADEQGDRVYFVANGRFNPEAVHGNCVRNSGKTTIPAAAAACNLYVYDGASEETRLVAVLSGRDFPDWGSEDATNLMWLTARVSPNGRYLAFMSERSLTGYDNRDARSGGRDKEVFRYDFEQSQLTCVSCDRTGARPHGVFDSGAFPGLLVDRPGIWSHQWVAASIPGWTSIGKVGLPIRAPHQSRYLANDGRLFFNSSEGLVSGDVNGQFDVYEYEPAGTGSCDLETGCVALMSSGLDGGETAFLDASSEGNDVFFLTQAKLSSNDTDSANDVYDAHVCTTAADCPSAASGAPPPCATSDACRAAPAPQPDIFGAPASSTFSGAGNLAPVGAATLKPKPLTKAQLLARGLKACHKVKAKKKRVSCERRARKKYGARKSSTAKGKKARRAWSAKKVGRR
jgi:NHL repeat/WD40-like Beta Propeller Repeat